MPLKFEVGNISVAKFVSITIIDSFVVHFIITISNLPYSDILSSIDHKVIMYVLTTNFHRQLVHEDLPYSSLEWLSGPFAHLLLCLQL